jgi:hypothetical protein
VLEHVLAARLRLVLASTRATILAGVKGVYVGSRQQAEQDELDLVTFVSDAGLNAFVVWEAKCSEYSPSKRRQEWKTTLTKAHRYTNCAPEDTHAIVVVPWIGKSATGYHEESGVTYVDFRILADDAAVLSLATKGLVQRPKM